MESETPIDEELIALTGALRKLQPADSRVDRDALLFNTGRAAARSQWTTSKDQRSRRSTHWIWPLTTAVSLCVAATSVAWRSDGERAVTSSATEPFAATNHDHNQVSVTAAAVPRITERPAPTYLLQLEQAVAGRFDDVESATFGGARESRPTTRDRLLEELLEETLL